MDQLARFQRTTRHLDSEPCLNCATPYSGNFCPNCGQECHTGAPTTWGFIYEFLTRNVLESGKLPRTLWHLVRYPGGLTVDFLEGRRERFIRPVRLFMTLSALYFLGLLLIGDKSTEEMFLAQKAGQAQGGGASTIVGKQLSDELRQAKALYSMMTVIAERCPQGALKQRAKRYVALSGPIRMEQFAASLPGALQKAMFFLVPVFAIFLKILFFRRKINYGAHLLFSIHFHTLMFLQYLLCLRMPIEFQPPVLLLIAVYLVIALRTTYVCGWWSAVWRMLALVVLYGFASFAAMGVAFVLGALM